MGRLGGTSEANLIVHARQEFEKELGIPAVASGADLQGPNRIGISANDSLVFKTSSGEVVELKPFDISQLDALFPAVYTAPTASLSSSGALVGEIGQTLNIPLVVNFNQNDAGSVIGYQILRNGAVIDGDANHTDAAVLTTAPFVYQGKVMYGAGNVKKNPLGNFYPTGQILAGSVMTNQITARGYYFVGYGSVSAQPTTSVQARALSSRLSNDVSKFNLMASTVMQVVIVPPDMELVSIVDLDALNIELFAGSGQYELRDSNFTVNNAAGVAVTGNKLYVRVQSIPYSTPHRHQVTLKRI